MRQEATVIAIDGDKAHVRAARSGSCNSCAGKASCSTLGSWQQRYSEVQVENRLGARVGDVVLLETPDRLLLKVMFRLYGVPMFAFIVVGLLARAFALQAGLPLPELLAAVAGVLAVIIYYYWPVSNEIADASDIRMLEIVTTHG